MTKNYQDKGVAADCTASTVGLWQSPGVYAVAPVPAVAVACSCCHPASCISDWPLARRSRPDRAAACSSPAGRSSLAQPATAARARKKADSWRLAAVLQEDREPSRLEMEEAGASGKRCFALPALRRVDNSLRLVARRRIDTYPAHPRCLPAFPRRGIC